MGKKKKRGQCKLARTRIFMDTGTRIHKPKHGKGSYTRDKQIKEGDENE